MNLLEKQTKLIELLRQLQITVPEALREKGVLIPEGKPFKLEDIPALIRTIYQNDFEFFFNFQDVDQFGTPKYPRRGQAAGGVILDLEAEMTLTPPVVDLSIDGHQPNLPLEGMFGVWTGGSDIESMLEVQELPTMTFSEEQFPVTFQPSPDDPSQVTA